MAMLLCLQVPTEKCSGLLFWQRSFSSGGNAVPGGPNIKPWYVEPSDAEHVQLPLARQPKRLQLRSQWRQDQWEQTGGGGLGVQSNTLCILWENKIIEETCFSLFFSSDKSSLTNWGIFFQTTYFTDLGGVVAKSKQCPLYPRIFWNNSQSCLNKRITTKIGSFL